MKIISVSQHCYTRTKRNTFRTNTNNNYFNNNSKNLYSTYYVPGIILSGFYYYPYFTNEETKAGRGEVTRLDHTSTQWQGYDLKLAPQSVAEPPCYTALFGLKRPKFTAGSATYQLDNLVEVTQSLSARFLIFKS